MTAAALLQSVDLQSFALGPLKSVAEVSAARILNSTAEGIGIALLAWILLRALGKQNSGTRFAAWFSTLLGIAALPLIGDFGSGSAEMARSQITVPAAWALYIFAAWLVLAAGGLIRLGIGFWHLRQLRKDCTPLDVSALDPVLQKTLQEFDSSRPVAICVSERLRVPTAVGFIKPLVVIPSWAVRELSPAELNTILLHELAHLRRWDDWTNLVQKVLGAVLFFHPAVWWIEKKLALEREMACDDLVLAKTANPRAYAECLVSLAETMAEKSLLRRGLALAQAAVGRMRHMSLRVARILDEKRPGATRVWRPAPVLLTGISLASLIAFSGAPRLVSFDNNAAGSATAPAAINVSQGSEEDSMSRAEAHVVPAKFVVRPEPEKTLSSADTLTARTVAGQTLANKTSADKAIAVNAKTTPGKPSVTPARVMERRANPTLIRTSVPEEEPISPTTLILIMQTGRYDAYGALVWDLSVWQVTLGPAQRGLQPEIIVKSI